MRLALGSGLISEGSIHLTDSADLAFWVDNRKYTGFQELNSACTTDVSRQGFLWHNELYELYTRRSLYKKG
jgi:hypothetical protein